MEDKKGNEKEEGERTESELIFVLPWIREG
jgi:hypothetical protein